MRWPQRIVAVTVLVALSRIYFGAHPLDQRRGGVAPRWGSLAAAIVWLSATDGQAAPVAPRYPSPLLVAVVFAMAGWPLFAPVRRRPESQLSRAFRTGSGEPASSGSCRSERTAQPVRLNNLRSAAIACRLSCGVAVLVDQPAEDVGSLNGHAGILAAGDGGSPQGWTLVKGSVWPMAVVVRLVIG